MVLLVLIALHASGRTENVRHLCRAARTGSALQADLDRFIAAAGELGSTSEVGWESRTSVGRRSVSTTLDASMSPRVITGCPARVGAFTEPPGQRQHLQALVGQGCRGGQNRG